MPVFSLRLGEESHKLEVASDQLILPTKARKSPTNTLEEAELEPVLLSVLENPLEFPELKRSITPDDKITILVKPRMVGLVTLLSCLLRYLHSAGIQYQQITLVSTSPGDTSFALRLSQEFEGVQLETHNRGAMPGEQELAYLATTETERRIYLHRSLVEADQLIVLGPLRYDPLFGISGGLTDIFPTLSDAETWKEYVLKLLTQSHTQSNIREEAEQVAWMLGMPFVISTVESQGRVLEIQAGLGKVVAADLEPLLKQTSEVTYSEKANLVIATLSGSDQSLSEVAAAFYSASKLIEQGGNLVVLSQATGEFPTGAAKMKGHEYLTQGLGETLNDSTTDALCWWQLTLASQLGRLILSSQFEEATLNEYSIIQLNEIEQLRKLVASSNKVAVLEDAYSAKVIQTEVAKK